MPCIPRQDSIRVSICLSEPLSGASLRVACFRPSVRGSFQGAAPARPFASPERFRPARFHPAVPCGRRSALPFVYAPARRFRRPLWERFATSRQARDRMSGVSIRRNESGCKNSKKVLPGIPARASLSARPCPRIPVRASCLSIPARASLSEYLCPRVLAPYAGGCVLSGFLSGAPFPRCSRPDYRTGSSICVALVRIVRPGASLSLVRFILCGIVRITRTGSSIRVALVRIVRPEASLSLVRFILCGIVGITAPVPPFALPCPDPPACREKTDSRPVASVSQRRRDFDAREFGRSAKSS